MYCEIYLVGSEVAVQVSFEAWHAIGLYIYIFERLLEMQFYLTALIRNAWTEGYAHRTRREAQFNCQIVFHTLFRNASHFYGLRGDNGQIAVAEVH
jgi:hypothetical protein